MSKKKSENEKQTLHDKRAAKKTAVLEAGKRGKNRLLFFVIPALVVLLTLIGVNLFNKMGKGPKGVAYADQVSHPVKIFDDGKARHFEFDAEDGLTIKYFVIKSSDGVVRAAFDACDVCWKSGKGYYQKGDYMVCRNCGKRFASVKVNEVKGGCNPAPLTRKVVGKNLVISVKDILEGRKYFDFSQRG